MPHDAPEVVRGLAIPLGTPPQALHALAAEKLGVAPEALAEVRPLKLSIDARGAAPRKVYAVEVWRCGASVPPAELPTVELPPHVRPLRPGEAPIIVGTGPAGLWAALALLQAGQPSILLERGGPVETRNRAVRGLRADGVLDPESNLCFGEGGAGTYSDGKLYTRVKDPRVRRVYRDLVAFGADPNLLIDAHPHVGTNRLIKMLRRIRGFLEAGGCELRFGARVVDLLRTSSGAVGGVRLADGTELSTRAVILAAGHSARDVYALLERHDVPLVRKPFAIGARVEHPQGLIDEIQLGAHAGHPDLGAAAYSLQARVGPRGVYSFCMCPGGFVIPTTTRVGCLNVNGMSNSNRGSRWANSALVVTVEPDEFWWERPGDLSGPLAGLALQEALERRAYEAGGGGYVAPAQRLTDFLDGRAGDVPGRTSYKPGVTAGDLRDVLPERVHSAIARAVLRFDKKLPGFLTREAVLIGVETTTSSPVRVPRLERTLTPEDIPGLYPCGEGSGYAGGIVSSAIDGLRVADAVVAQAQPPQSTTSKL